MIVFDWKNGVNQNELNIVVDMLKKDELVILPTETVYGLGANACSNIACKKIFEAKGRAQDNPLIVHVSDMNMIGRVVQDLSEIEEKLVKAFMPGPFTLILKKSKVISDVASCNMDTIGVRMPSNKIINEVISKCGFPIAAPSANISGRPSGTNVDDIIDEFDDRVSIIVDGGDSDIGIESTVVKVIDNIPVILRPGFITEDDIKKVVRNS